MFERVNNTWRFLIALLIVAIGLTACGGGNSGDNGNTNNTNNPPVGVPIIIGTAANGETLTTDTTGISDDDGVGNLSYEWLRDSTVITSAISNTYTLGVADIGSQIRVRVSYTDGLGNFETVTSDPTAVVTDVNNAPAGVPIITGTLINGNTLTADVSGISDADGLGAFSYQWLRDGVNIPGATSATYLLGGNDVDTQISVAVSYTDGKGFDETVTSTETAAILNQNSPPVGVPTISGTAADNEFLTADTLGISDINGLGTFSYQWLRTPLNSPTENIPGANADTYTVSDDDVGAQISVRVSYTDDFGSNESVTSDLTAAVTDVNDPPVGLPLITGIVSNGQTLGVDTSGISDADGIVSAFSYQWLADNVAITGATTATYTLSDADLGTQISVTVSYTDGCVGCSTTESVTSAQTAPVPNNVATLADLTISSGQLDQVFQTSLLDYTAAVGFLSASLSVTATSTDPNASIDINGNAVTSGVVSPEIPLVEGDNTITITVTATDGTTTQIYTITVTRALSTSFAQQAYLKASDAASNQKFGYSVAISGDILVVGAYQQNNNTGAAYVFVRSGGVWTEQQILTASNAEVDDRFGRSVAIAGDTIVVGADGEDSIVVGDQTNNTTITSPYFGQAGAAYVFTRDTTLNIWNQTDYLKADNASEGDFFGFSVAIAGNENTIVVGAWGEDSGIKGAANATNAGAVYVFILDTGVWIQQPMIKTNDAQASDLFGYSVDISGNTIVAGAYLETTGGDGAGAAYVFTRTAGIWTQQAKLMASNAEANDNFGHSVAVAGDTAVIGAWLEDSSSSDESDNFASAAGAAYVFTRTAGVWTQQAYLKADNASAADYFGTSVAITGDTVLVGAYRESSSANNSGAAYVFTRAAGAWTQQANLKADNAGANDEFGRSVAIAEDTLVVGADGEASSTIIDPADDTAPNAGAAYVWQ